MENKITRWLKEPIPVYLYYGLLFLLPIFFLPLVFEPLNSGKFYLFSFFVLISSFLIIFPMAKKGEITFPKSLIFASFGLIVLVSLISSLFSLNPKISLWGGGFEIDTFLNIFIIFIAIISSSIIFQSEKRVLWGYLAIVSAGAVCFIVQAIRIFFDFNFFPFSILSLKTANFIGTWNDFAIFFGFLAITALSLFELFKFSRFIRMILVAILLFSMSAMLVVNFQASWIIFGLFSLLLFIYLTSTSWSKGAEGKKNLGISWYSLGVVVFVLIVLIGNSFVRDVVVSIQTDNLDVRPSLSGTLEIIKDSWGNNVKNIIIGAGPNTFLYSWLKFKSAGINLTDFWDSRFKFGYSLFVSMASTLGIAGILSVLFFLFSIGRMFLKSLFYSESNLARTLFVSSAFGTVYLWAFCLLYSPSIIVVYLAALMTGIMVAMGAKISVIKKISFSILKNQKTAFLGVSGVVIIVLILAGASFFVFSKSFATAMFTNGVKAFNSTGDLQDASAKISKAARIDRQDFYFRNLAEIDLIELQRILNSSNIPIETARIQFQKILNDAINNGKNAVAINPLDTLNWLELGRIYELIIPLGIANSEEFATAAYQEAIKTSPESPKPFLGLARVEMAKENFDVAKNYVYSSLQKKNNFTDAYFLLSQIETKLGNLDGAIASVEQVVSINPNDINLLFQLGLMNYQAKRYDNAMIVLERAVSLAPVFSNARYFLGLTYSKKGMVEEAIIQFERIEELNPDNQEVKTILANLRAGKAPLSEISPPGKAPEERESPPVTNSR